jgi:hypothetical protein
VGFIVLIHEHFRSRMVKMPVFSGRMLQSLNMPVLAIAGGRDVLLDSEGTRRRLPRHVRRADVRSSFAHLHGSGLDAFARESGVIHSCPTKDTDEEPAEAAPVFRARYDLFCPDAQSSCYWHW